MQGHCYKLLKIKTGKEQFKETLYGTPSTTYLLFSDYSRIY